MRIDSESGWCDSAPEGERARECREGTWGRHEVEEKNLQENGHGAKERFGRFKIILTLSLDSTHYSSIQ